MSKQDKKALIIKIENEMKEAAKIMDFERAMELRDILFELKAGGQTMNIQITPDKTVGDAINSYRNKIQIEGEMKFIFNGLNLDPRLTLKAAGLKNNSKILVITTKDIEGA